MPIAVITTRLRTGQFWVPWFVLIVGLVTTVAAAWYIRQSAMIREQTRFNGLADAAVDQLNGAMDDYTAVLRSASGLFAAAGNVNADQFDAFATEMDLTRRFPALRGIGYAPRVRSDHLAEFTAYARQQVDPEFTVFNFNKSKVSGESYPNFYLAPRDGRKRPGLGLNLISEKARATALHVACDTASPMSTSRLHLLSQEKNDPVGAFLIYFPIYGGGKAPATVEARRAKLTGTVFVGFRADEFFDHAFDSEIRDRMQIFVYDDNNDNTAPAQLFDPTRNKHETPDFKPHLGQTRDVEVAGRTWTLRMSERRAFDRESGEPLTPFILLGGLGISLMLFGVTRGQAVAQAAAERSAAALTLSSEALRASQARIRRLVDSNLIGVFFCSIDGKITEGNDEFFRLIGRHRDGVQHPTGVRLDAVISPADLEVQQQALHLLQDSGVAAPRESSFVRPDGSAVPVLIGLAAVDDSRTDAVAFTIDLTERKRAERELRSAKEAAESANKSKDQFLAVLSHELRTPLTPVLAVTAAASDDLSLSPDVRGEMAMIHRNIELEAKLIDDLLDLTRIGRGKLQLQIETVDVHRVIDAAIEVSSSADMVSKKLVIERELSAHSHYVRGDPARLQQVFWNLIKNAVKFTPAGGKIRVRTFDLQPTVSAKKSFCAEVTDDGMGIEAELLPKIFDAFEQGTIARAQASGGLGLGLAITRGLVDAHGGEITARSDGKGHGATFVVCLPVTALTLNENKNGSPIPTAQTKPAFRILLVEDHIDTANVLARLLRMGGHQVEIAHCVADALRLSNEKQFELLVSDLGLPDGSGIDVIQGVRGNVNQASILAIALTGYGAEMDVARTAAAGFNEHLTKPISFQKLQQAIDRVAGKRSPT